MANIIRRLIEPKCGALINVSANNLHISAVQLSSPFVKAQKKMDPEIAKLREERKRRKLKKEIKLLESFGKKPKPVEEFIFDKKYEASINERIRPKVEFIYRVVQILGTKSSNGEMSRCSYPRNAYIFDSHGIIKLGLILVTSG
ncbi:unnamed protein product [Wuchereria bancrofti]|uniref:Uncharacterized protein n=1 Tax=Wuchereria bancrofti TaxID=6293 RepID=A0A3P7E691_WUCBA|nr:unnamed protein product [Wuchereria bancrofti]